MHKNLDSFHNIVIQTYTNFTMETYKKNSKNHKSNYFSDLKNMLTDEEFACPTFKLLDHITDDNEVFMYIYDYRIDTSKYPAWYGVVNGDELASVNLIIFNIIFIIFRCEITYIFFGKIRYLANHLKP